MKQQIRELMQENIVQERIDGFKVGDGVKVYTKIQEGEKERIQIFAGIVIARKGSGNSETFTVRRISFGKGVEKVFPIHSTNIEKIEVDRTSLPMRAKLYYLRQRIGKEAVKIKEKKFKTKAE